MKIAFDTEFSFDPDNEFHLVCAAVTQEDGVGKAWWRDELDDFKEYVNAHKHDTWIFHSGETAEGYAFQSLGIRPTSLKCHDTYLMAKVVENSTATNRPLYSLPEVLARYTDHRRDKLEKKENQSICIFHPEEGSPATTWRSWEDHLALLEENRQRLLDYCLEDTKDLVELDDILSGLLEETLDDDAKIDHDRAMDPSLRADFLGRYAMICSEISWRGIPLNAERVRVVKENAPLAMARMQREFMEKYPGSFREVDGRLVQDMKVLRALAAKEYGNNPPTTETGAVSLASKDLKPHKHVPGFLGDFYRLKKELQPLLSFSKSERNRNWLGGYLPKRGIIRPQIGPLSAKTGRNGSKPSSGFIYTMAKPFRGLVDPPEGFVLVELDYHSEEIGIAAYLTGDPNMIRWYEGPDYYTSMAQELDHTVKDKHDPRRAMFKTFSLAMNYGAGVENLSRVTGMDESDVRDLKDRLKEDVFPEFWAFQDNLKEEVVRWQGRPWFSDGFRVEHDIFDGKITTLLNWWCQGCGAYILRRLLYELHKRDIQIVAPIHDAVVFMCREEEMEEKIAEVSEIMRKVSEAACGRPIDVGEPEVTFHGIVNCHSELKTREQYATTPDNEHAKTFKRLLQEVPGTLQFSEDVCWLDDMTRLYTGVGR